MSLEAQERQEYTFESWTSCDTSSGTGEGGSLE